MRESAVREAAPGNHRAMEWQFIVNVSQRQPTPTVQVSEGVLALRD